jgi:HAD superfamily hydrolase (TIGR01549 family)
MNKIPYEKIKTIFLDAGNTLVSMDFEWIRELLEGCDVSCSLESLRRAEAAARLPLSAALESLKSTEGEDAFDFYMRNILERLPGIEVSEDGMIEKVTKEIMPVLRAPGQTQRLWSYVLPGVPEALKTLKNEGYQLVVISNSDGTVEESLSNTGLLPYLNEVVDSHWAGFEKPDPRLFKHALELVGANSEETLHIGDMYHVDITGARSAGIHALLLDPFNDWENVDCVRFPDLLKWVKAMIKG